MPLFWRHLVTISFRGSSAAAAYQVGDMGCGVGSTLLAASGAISSLRDGAWEAEQEGDGEGRSLRLGVGERLGGRRVEREGLEKREREDDQERLLLLPMLSPR